VGVRGVSLDDVWGDGARGTVDAVAADASVAGVDVGVRDATLSARTDIGECALISAHRAPIITQQMLTPQTTSHTHRIVAGIRPPTAAART
jgi:hypothetical protein